MKIEFLESGSDDCLLIRIYGNEPHVCQTIRESVMALANGDVDCIDLTDLPGIESIGGCRLTAEPGHRDEGIVQKEKDTFIWTLKSATWEDVALLIDAFSEPGPEERYQWVDQAPTSEIRVLISTSGRW